MFDVDAARQQISWAAVGSRRSLNAIVDVLLPLKDNPYITVCVRTLIHSPERSTVWGASIHLYVDGVIVIPLQPFDSFLYGIFEALQDKSSRRGETPEMVELQALLMHIRLTAKEKGLL